MKSQTEAVDEVAEYYRANPKSFAAKVKPVAARVGAGWKICYGPEIPGQSVFGWTLAATFASWEANYREAVTAQQ